MGPRQLQKYLKDKGHYAGLIDGKIGPQSKAAIAALVHKHSRMNSLSLGLSTWSDKRHRIAAMQIMLQELGHYEGRVDGLDGPNTQYALELYQNVLRDEDDNGVTYTVGTRWPTYAQMNSFYGPVGQNQKRFTLPYEMRLAWDTDVAVTRMTLHQRCGESAMNVLSACYDHYGVQGIKDLRLDLFGGSLNVRKMRGGSRYSTHSWGAAIDIDPSNNQFRWTDDRATLDDPAYDFWWEQWEAQGWVSLGRARNFDWMHVQAVRL